MAKQALAQEWAVTGVKQLDRQNNLHITRTNHEYAKRCIRHNIPRTINNTTALILNKIDTHCQTGFVTYAKMYTIVHEDCEITNCHICRCAEL